MMCRRDKSDISIGAKKGSTHRLVLYTLEAGGLLILRSNYLLVAVLQAYKNDQALN